jgi:hypothetical protein
MNDNMLLILLKIHSIVLVIVSDHVLFSNLHSLCPSIELPGDHHDFRIWDIWLQGSQKCTLKLGDFIVKISDLLHYILSVHFDIVSWYISCITQLALSQL